MYENYFCGVICMIKKISAAAIAVIMSASMMFTTASADASYVLDKDAGEDFVNFIDGKLPDILKSMDSVAGGDKIYFDYGSWFMDLDYDGVPEFIIGGEMADGDRHYSILTKDGKEIKIDDTVANGQYFPGFMGFDYMPYRDLYTGEVSYFSSNDKIKTMTFDPEKGVTEKELCSEEYDLETDSTVYKTDGKEVSESEYYNYKSTLSRFIPLEVENTELTSDETAQADADKLLEMYNEYNCVVMTAENKKDDMTSVIVEMLDLLKEIMADVPSEIADDVDWSYNSWFEDLNFDGVPDFVIGGIADLLDEGTALRLYDVIGMGNAGFLADTNVSNDHGDGENGFGFKPYVNKQTGEKTYLSEDRYAEDGKEHYAVRKLFSCLGECLTADICTAEYDSKKGVTSYTIEGKEATSEEFQAYLAKLNSDYDELSVTISTMGENKVPNNEGTLAESYDEYKLGDVVGGASFTYVEKKNTSNDISNPDKTAGSQASKNYNTDSSTNPSTGAAAGVTAAIIAAGAGLAICAKRKKK
jgi:hypothetical protein